MIATFLGLRAVADRFLTRQPASTLVVTLWTIGVSVSLACGVAPW